MRHGNIDHMGLGVFNLFYGTNNQRISFFMNRTYLVQIQIDRIGNYPIKTM